MNTGYYHDEFTKAMVKTMLDGKKSYTEISAQLGMTRNQVAGLARRIKGLPNTSGTQKPRGWTAKKIKDAKAPPPPAIGPVDDFPASTACRFIAGEPGKNFQCCGQPGYPFCDYHRAVCYPKPRVMEAAVNG